MEYTTTQLGELVRDTRKGNSLTQEELAMAAGTGIRFIIDLEKGKPTCQLGKTLTVLNTLGIKVVVSEPPSGKTREQLANRDTD